MIIRNIIFSQYNQIHMIFPIKIHAFNNKCWETNPTLQS